MDARHLQASTRRISACIACIEDGRLSCHEDADAYVCLGAVLDQYSAAECCLTIVLCCLHLAVQASAVTHPRTMPKVFSTSGSCIPALPSILICSSHACSGQADSARHSWQATLQGLHRHHASAPAGNAFLSTPFGWPVDGTRGMLCAGAGPADTADGCLGSPSPACPGLSTRARPPPSLRSTPAGRSSSLSPPCEPSHNLCTLRPSAGPARPHTCHCCHASMRHAEPSVPSSQARGNLACCTAFEKGLPRRQQARQMTSFKIHTLNLAGQPDLDSQGPMPIVRVGASHESPAVGESGRG